MATSFDYIIVGQGIAGTVLGYSMIKEGLRVLVIDDKSHSTCSKVAAGNFNPIVFKRLVKSWMADELIPFSDTFYKEAEQFLGQEFYWKKEIVKIFAEENEKNFWLQKANTDDAGNYLSKTITTDFFTDTVNNPLGCAFVKDAANLFVVKFLDDFRNYFIQQNCLLDERFDYQQLVIETNSVRYKNNSATKIIFCEGYKIADNPYFKWLPFKPAKGEVLIVKIKNLNTDKIINKGVYLFAIGDDLFIAGSTYDWVNLNDIPTEKAKNEIAEKLSKIIKTPFEIIDQQAGVRPSVSDRRPVIGLHPEHPALGVFNGMGTKGVMLAPYFAKQFIDYLTHQTPMNKEVDCIRFMKGN